MKGLTSIKEYRTKEFSTVQVCCPTSILSCFVYIYIYIYIYIYVCGVSGLPALYGN